MPGKSRTSIMTGGELENAIANLLDAMEEEWEHYARILPIPAKHEAEEFLDKIRREKRGERVF